MIIFLNVFWDETLIFIKKYFTGHAGAGSKSKSRTVLQLCFHSSAAADTSFVRLSTS